MGGDDTRRMIERDHEEGEPAGEGEPVGTTNKGGRADEEGENGESDLFLNLGGRGASWVEVA